ncbi:hypothetical protein EUTSA_v10022174mg, partial [Eutrema salsugineum]
MAQPNQNNNNHDHKFTKIFVGGLAWEITTDDLIRYFQGLGEEVLHANVVTGTFPGGITKSRGYGFVTFKYADSAARACEPPYPVFYGRTTNINLAYIRAKNNTNQPNQNGWINQVPLHQYQPYSHYTHPYFPQPNWYPNYGQYCFMYNVPHYPYGPYPTTRLPTTMNWQQSTPDGIFPPPHNGVRLEDITETNQEADATHNDDNSEEADTETDSDVDDQQKGNDQQGEVSEQDNGINQDDRELEMTSGQDDDIKQDTDVTEQLDNGTEFPPQ